MFTADEARKLSDEASAPVLSSPEFKAVMAGLECDIRRAAADGFRCFRLKSYELQKYNGYKFPNGLDASSVNGNLFWLRYVKPELEKLGFKILSMLNDDEYAVMW